MCSSTCVNTDEAFLCTLSVGLTPDPAGDVFVESKLAYGLPNVRTISLIGQAGPEHGKRRCPPSTPR
jgi:hypothetical protein